MTREESGKRINGHEEELKDNLALEKALYDMWAAMIRIKDIHSMHKFIADSIHNRCPGSMILYVSIDEPKDEVYLETIAGLAKEQLELIAGIAGFNPVGTKFKIIPSHREFFRSGKLV